MTSNGSSLRFTMPSRLCQLLLGLMLGFCSTHARALPSPPPDATFVSQSVPGTMTVGRTYVVSITMKNTGTDAWLVGGTYKLGSQNPANNLTWGTSRAILSAAAASGQTATFSFQVKAPASPGTYNFQWRMLREPKTWFGSTTPNIAIAVANDASNTPPTVSLTAPASGGSQDAPANVTLSANAADSGGSVVSVNFLSNGVSVGTDTSAPYSVSLTALPAGTYSFSATALDNGGATTTSAAVPFTATVAAANASTATRSYVYDSSQRLCKTINPESGATIVDYDGDGRIAWVAEGLSLTGPTCDRGLVADSAKSTRSYDSLDRLLAVTTPGGIADVTTTFAPDGQVASVSAANPGAAPVVTSYSYNKRRLLTGETSANGASMLSVGYGYDANAFQSSLSYPDGQAVVFSPDGLGRATEVRAAGGATYASAISYYPGGAIQGFTYGNGVVHTMVQNARRLPARSTDQIGAAKVIDDSYSFDRNGNVTDITDQAQNGLTTRGMAYDGLDRLTVAASPAQWGNAAWTYDALDNIRSADQGARQYRYNYDAANRLTNIKTPAGLLQYAFGYDVRGNTTSRNSQAYSFDVANRLNQVNGLQVYRYDGLGRRVQTTDADGKTTFWIYGQGGQVFYTSEARRSQNLSYIYLGNTQVATRTVAWGTGAVAVRFEHTDSLGSPVAETGPTGAVLNRNSFTAYGEPWAQTRVDGTGYTGHVMDQATGLTYMQQRFYDPATGHFLSLDPAAVKSKIPLNFCRYCYASDNSYRFNDPDGRTSEELEVRATTGRVAAAFKQFQEASLAPAVEAADAELVNPANYVGGIALEGKAAKGALGIVYRRTDPLTGAKYIGQAKSAARYLARQVEHGKNYVFEIVGKAEPGKALRYLEEKCVRAEGGLTTLENKISAMSDKKFKEFEKIMQKLME